MRSFKRLLSLRWPNHTSVRGTAASRLFLEEVRVKIKSENDANKLIDALKPYERAHLLRTLQGRSDVPPISDALPNGEDASSLSRDQIKALFWINALPFVGFGFLDNVIMILAGEYIDMTMGVVLGLSTMAAAGIGNMISDVAGVGLAHYVEFLVGKFGMRPPALTAQQIESGKARWTANLGRSGGIIIGCLIGMFPLFFFDEAEKLAIKRQAEENANE